jgi:Putative DNA-binding domain
VAILEGRGVFMPITRLEELPELGRSIETRTIDFKIKHSSDRFEAGKDVAAFANTSGGTIIIGARTTGDVLAEYLPLSAADAQAAKRDYEESVRDRCSPAPIFDVSFFTMDGGILVAINVWPIPGQPVGVELKPLDLKTYEREAKGTYFYPVRVGSHTRAILPEQLPMFIDAKSRKAAIVLSRAIGKTLVMAVPKYEKNKLWRDDALKLLDVNAHDNNLVVGLDTFRVSLPLDSIETAWVDGERVCVVVNGYIEQLDTPESEPPGSGGYFFMPLPRFLLVDPNAR